MTKHTAKRIDAGEYSYRGFHIEEVGRYDERPTARWNITAPGEDSAEDASNTLGEAKAMIDHWLS